MNQFIIILLIVLVIYIVRKTEYETWKFSTLTFFSLLIPGLGQFNRESYLEAFLWFLITGFSFSFSLVLWIICWLANAYFTGLEVPIYLIPRENKNKKQAEEKNTKTKPQKIPVYKIILGLLFVVVGATLPFHYAPNHGMAFPKENFTFSNTFIFDDDIERLVKRYNEANFFEKGAIVEEPLYKKLKEKGLIFDQDMVNQDDLEKLW